MRKKCFCWILFIVMLALLTACGSKKDVNNDVTGSMPTAGEAAPTATTAPTPVVTSDEVEKQPELTNAPEVSEKPETTKTPTSPKEVKASLAEGDITYNMDELTFVKAPRTEYTMQEDGSVDVRFKQMDYAEIRFLLPARIDLNECSGITVRMRADCDVKCMLLNNNALWNRDCTAFYEEYTYAEGSLKEYYLTPHKVEEVYGIGFTPTQEVDDFSLYKATVYSITFHAKGAEDGTANASQETTAKLTPTPRVSYPKADVTKGDICYSSDKLKIRVADRVSHTVNAGSMKLRFDALYGQIRLLLPEAIDTSQCTGISIKMKAKDTWIGVTYYGDGFVGHPTEDESELFENFVEIRDEVDEQGFYVPDIGYIYGIALTHYGDENTQGVYEAAIESITFHMLSGNTVSIPYDIAPDVTEDMTLLNTYGTVLDKMGTQVFVAGLKNPAVVQELKKHYNSVVLCEGTFLDMIVPNPIEAITVEEARKLGYIIPDNYREEIVPKMDFEQLDEILKICAENDLMFRFHCLMWHDTEYDYFYRSNYKESGALVSQEVMDARLEFYVRTVMEHVYGGAYGDVVCDWIVMNEYLKASTPESNCIKVYGDLGLKPEYLKLIYTVADDVLRKYGIRDKVALIFNEYDTYFVDHTGRDMTQDILSVLEYINSDGMVCDTIGMQSHLDTTIPIKGKQKKALQAFLDAGYAVQISELDVTIPTSEAGKESQEKYYCEVMEMLLEFARKGEKITGLTFWGASDSISWLKEFSPLMFTHLGRPKDAYYKVIQTYLDPDRIPKEETADITYGCDELNYVLDYVGDYTINQDGSLNVAFQDQYQEIMFQLPEAIDMKQCVGITVKAKSEYSDLAVKLYGADWLAEPFSNPVYQYNGCLGEGVLNYDKLLEREETVYGIGFMSLHNVKDFSKYKATVYSVTFHMEPGYQQQ